MARAILLPLKPRQPQRHFAEASLSSICFARDGDDGCELSMLDFPPSSAASF